MSLQQFFTKTVTVKRLVGGVGGNPDKFDFQTVGTVMANTQPTTPEQQQFIDGVLGTSFNLYCARSADLKKGDRLTIDSIDYDLKGDPMDFDEGGIGHKEAVIVKAIS